MSDQLERLKQAQAARKASIAAWRSSSLHEKTLPSGLTVFLRDVNLTDVLTTGKLPPLLSKEAAKAAEGGQASIDLNALMENAQEFGQLLNTLVLLCVVEPPIAEVADDDHIALSEIRGDDKMFIFNWVNRETEAVRSFRDEGEPDPSGLSSATLLDETQPNDPLADRLGKLAN